MNLKETPEQELRKKYNEADELLYNADTYEETQAYLNTQADIRSEVVRRFLEG